MLSVVTPVRNMARYLPETLDSVAALSVPHEHVVIDGASKDGTVELLESRDDPALRFRSEPDTGQTEAVNKGLAMGQGELVAWLNADDTYEPDAVDAAVAYLDANPDAMALLGGIRYTEADGSVFRTVIPGTFRWRRALLWGASPAWPAVIFRSSLLEKVGGLDERWADGADFGFFMAMLEDERVDSFDRPLVRFRYHPASKTVTDVWRQHDELLAIRLEMARNGAGARVDPGERALQAGDPAEDLVLARPPSGVVRLSGRG